MAKKIPGEGFVGLSPRRIRVEIDYSNQTPWLERAPNNRITLEDAYSAVNSVWSSHIQDAAPRAIPLSMDLTAYSDLLLPGFVLNRQAIYLVGDLRITRWLRGSGTVPHWGRDKGLVDMSMSPGDAIRVGGKIWAGLRDVPLEALFIYAHQRKWLSEQDPPSTVYTTVGAIKQFFGLQYPDLCENSNIVAGTFTSRSQILDACVLPRGYGSPPPQSRMKVSSLSAWIGEYGGRPALVGYYRQDGSTSRRNFLIPEGFDIKAYMTVAGRLPTRMEISRMWPVAVAPRSGFSCGDRAR